MLERKLKEALAVELRCSLITSKIDVKSDEGRNNSETDKYFEEENHAALVDSLFDMINDNHKEFHPDHISCYEAKGCFLVRHLEVYTSQLSKEDIF